MIDLDILNTTDNKVYFSPSGNKLSGVEALAQRVLIVLLTRVSDVLREHEGTRLPSIGSSMQFGVDYMSLILSSAIFDACSVIRKDTDTTDPREQLNDVRIANISIDNDLVVFTIDVYNNAGDVSTLSASSGV